MLSPADRIIEATLPYTLRPKGNDREKVIAAVLEFVIKEFQDYREFGCGEMVISCSDLWELIDELRDTVTIEEPVQDLTTDAPEAL
jgi:hypothetical protein